MSNALPLIIVIPLLTAVIALSFRHRPGIQRAVGFAGSLVLLCASVPIFLCVLERGYLSTQIGSWPAPYGITIVADTLSALLIVATALVVLLISIASWIEIDPARESFGYTPLLHFLIMGICGSFLTGDVFNLYVWFEVMLIASFVLLGLGGEKPQLEGTIKYVALNLLSSALFLAAIGVLYGTYGTLNMADLAMQLRESRPSHLVITLATLFLLAFGIKAAVFPLFFWLPASYHTPPVPISAIFAGLLTKVGIYSLIRFFTLIFTQDAEALHRLILILAALTMIVGILGALVQKDFRRIISFNLISHIGTLLAGLGLFTPLALAGTVFYLIHDIVSKTCLFLFTSVVQRLGGSGDIRNLGGLYRSNPRISLLFAIVALSVAGIPPLSGFWGKLVLVQAGLIKREYWLVAAILFASILTLYSMCGIWSEAFWKDSSGTPVEFANPGRKASSIPLLLLAPITSLVLLILLMGIWPAPFFETAKLAAQQLSNPDHYIRTILGEKP